MSDEPSRGVKSSLWADFLDGKTTAQRAVFALALFVAGVATIGGAVVAVVQFVDNGDGPSSSASNGESMLIEGQTAGAGDFLQYLLDNDGRVVELDHQILGTVDPGGVKLEYACSTVGGCSIVHLRDVDVTFAGIDGGIWFQGCYRVRRDGNGYQADELDIWLDRSGETCPTE